MSTSFEANYYGYTFTSIDAKRLGQGTIDGVRKGGGGYFSSLPIGSVANRKRRKTQASVEICDSVVVFTDDYGHVHRVHVFEASSEWWDTLRQSLESNELLKSSA